MSDIKDKLQALFARKDLMTGPEWRRKLDALAEQRASGAYEIDKIVPGETIEMGDSAFYRVRTDYPLDTVHGGVTLRAVLDAFPAYVALSANDTELEAFNPSAALFMDTETGGLSGGAGAIAFMVGAGYFTGNCFRIEQCFMRDYDDEEAMIEYLDTLFARADAVVSYNGKTFDLPLLRTRFIQNRRPFRLEGCLHYDLLHAARRIWKLRLGDCSLGNIERSVLGFRRQGDVPSWEIPQIWYDYLRTRDARKLDRVFYHHRCDILSLASLTALLSLQLAEPEGAGFIHHEDRVSLLRLQFRRRAYDDAAALGFRLLEGDLAPGLRHNVLTLLALALKRSGAWDLAGETLELLVREYPRDIGARLELAKVYEHRLRNLGEARRLCLETISLLDTRMALDQGGPDAPPERAAFAQRLARIERKLARRQQ